MIAQDIARGEQEPAIDNDAAGPDNPLTRSLSAADQVREAILSGAFSPGARINEVHLSRELGMSRTPTRAALHALAAEGLLDYARNRGFLVREFPLQAVLDAYEIRASLEGVACRLAAERGFSSAQKAEIERALREGEEILEAAELGERELAAYRRVNVVIHDTIITAARNRMLTETVRLTLNMPAATTRHIVAFTHRDVRRRHDDHHRIYDLICAGEGARAEALMKEHVIGIKAELAKGSAG